MVEILHTEGMKKPPRPPAGHSYTILKQLCQLLPGHLVMQLAKEHHVTERSRSFSPWSHVVALLHAHLTHAISLNDVCDALQLNAPALSTVRGATPPSRNALSHANRERNADLAEALYWHMQAQVLNQPEGFGQGPLRRGYLRRLHTPLHAIDSTTITLVANSLDWAQHRRRKAAAKCHLRLDLHSFLPQCVIVTSAQGHDSRQARPLCAGVASGESVIFDKAYVDFVHLRELTARGVWWVSRGKDNLQYRVVRTLATTTHASIVRDELIELTVERTHAAYPQLLRRVVARVERDGRMEELVFLTNQLQWSAWTVAELYRSRWEIEVFFKELKQTLQLSDFLGYNENAVRWQIWIGLLVSLLLRWLRFRHGWRHSLARLCTLVRATLWRRWDLALLVATYGTAAPPGRLRAAPEQAYLPGFA